MQKHIISYSEAETRTVARELFEKYIPGVLKTGKPLVIMLYGNLGVGKTVFTKEIGMALGLNDIVSPAFVVYYEYPVHRDGVKFMYHFDLYRITEPNEFDHLGIEEILKPGNIIVIEWSEKSGPVLELLKSKSTFIEVRFEHKGEDARSIIITEPEQ
jgi:tRNA threonylcarbamoyl adenosine modification protein YjeE